jgi:hypothetical protein
MAAPAFGTIILVPFPFTDQSAAKQRPAVVVSSHAYHRARQDLILMPISSQLRVNAFGESEPSRRNPYTGVSHRSPVMRRRCPSHRRPCGHDAGFAGCVLEQRGAHVPDGGSGAWG